MSAVLDAAIARLTAELPAAPDKPEETPQSTAAALLFAAAGQPRPVTRATAPFPALDAAGETRFAELLARRLAGEPLAYITGRQEFLGIEFHTAPGALIPRRETELLGADALEVLAKLRPDANVLDLCTGSGNLAVAMAVHHRGIRVWATDLEADALALARRNVELHGVQSRVSIHQGDLFGALENSGAPRFDLITCNPPYLTSKHAQNMPQEIGGSEPSAAFDGGPFGISITLRLIREAPEFLVPGGWLCFELGAGQGPMLQKRLQGNPAYVECRPKLDAEGTIRALQARIAG
jgi:release factor glutamine methyltransferase